jgi:RND family efflux transporter MFP subunit
MSMVTFRKRIQLIASVIVMGVVGVVMNSCSPSSGNDVENAGVAKAPDVEVVKVKRQKLTSLLNMPGELISFQRVDLYAREASFVKDIKVDVGSEVKKGQVLATLEAPEITSRLSGAESRLKATEAVYLASKSGYERLVETSKTPGTISPNDLDQAVGKMNADLAQLESAKAAVKEIKNTLGYLTIRAPFSGVISERNVNPGAYVGSAGRGAGDPLFVLQEQKHLRLVVSIPEAYGAFLKTGDEVSFQIKALPQQSFTARVVRMAGALDAKLRSQRVEMDVVNDSGKLLPGMIANVRIALNGSDNSLTVPRSAIVHSLESVFVIRVENDTARWVNIEPGRTSEDVTEIYGPVKEGDVLVKKATDEVRNGSWVSAVPAKEE